MFCMASTMHDQPISGDGDMKPLELKADLSELQRQADELTSLGFEA
jgi:hypothetical protein